MTAIADDGSEESDSARFDWRAGRHLRRRVIFAFMRVGLVTGLLCVLYALAPLDRTDGAALVQICLALVAYLGIVAWQIMAVVRSSYPRQNYAAAASWYRKAAARGLAAAQSNLGVMYDKGQGVPENHAEASKWYRLAADQGDADAQFNLGVMYFYGRGLPKDYAETVKWFHRASERGQASAEFNLGVIYAKGQGVPQDYVQAHVWFNRAARNASDAEERDRAVKCDSVAMYMTMGQIAEAQRLVRSGQSHAP